MSIAETLPQMRYVTDINGEKTDVIISFKTWQTLLAQWQQLLERLEDVEDLSIIANWIAQNQSGRVSTLSLDAFEQELIADGLLPSSN